MTTAKTPVVPQKGGLGDRGVEQIAGLKKGIANLAKKPPKLEIPKRGPADVEQFELLEMELDEAGKADARLAPEISEFMLKTSLPWLEKFQRTCDRLKSIGAEDQMEKIQKQASGQKGDSEEPLSNEALRDFYLAKNEEFLNAAFSVGPENDPIIIPAPRILKSAHMAVIVFKLQKIQKLEELLGFEQWAIEQDYLVRDDKGSIWIQRRRYAISQDKKFGSLAEEQDSLAEIISNVKREIDSNLRAQQKEMIEVLRGESEITLEELLTNKPGKCLVHVPAGTLNGERHGERLPECYVLFNGDGQGRIFIISAAGEDMEMAEEISASKTHLNLDHLNVRNPPREEIMTSKWRGFDRKKALQYQRIWSYAFRARQAMEEQKIQIQRDQERKEKEEAERQRIQAMAKALEEAPRLKEVYRGEATIDLDAVFTEQPKPGIFFAEYFGDWNNQKQGICVANGLLFFLGEISIGEDGKPQMRIKSAPEHLKNSLFKNGNFEFAPCGERFKDLAHCAPDVMQAIFGQIKKRKKAQVA